MVVCYNPYCDKVGEYGHTIRTKDLKVKFCSDCIVNIHYCPSDKHTYLKAYRKTRLKRSTRDDWLIMNLDTDEQRTRDLTTSCDTYWGLEGIQVVRGDNLIWKNGFEEKPSLTTYQIIKKLELEDIKNGDRFREIVRKEEKRKRYDI